MAQRPAENNANPDRWSDLRRLPVWLRILLGAALGTTPMLVSMRMSPSHRSPYLLAYPVVIFCAWVLGPAGSIMSALVAGMLTEHFIFSTRQINLEPTGSGMYFRESVFLLGSVLAGLVTRATAEQQNRLSTMRLREQLAIAEAQQAVARERERTAELTRENEARAVLALDGADVGLWEWDMDTGKSKWSAGFYRLHGLSSDTPAGYDAWHAAVHPEDRSRVDAELEEAVRTGGTFHSEYRIVLPGEETRWVACQGTCVLENGRPHRMIGFAGDVTRRKLADQALLQSEKLAVAGRLAASIAHEINNPLEAAMNLVYLASSATSDRELLSYLDTATEQLTRVFTITRQTLSFARASGRAGTARASDLVRSTLELLRAKLALASVTVRHDVLDDPEFVCAPGELRQILTNLINNSAEAMPGPGEIRIRIRSSVHWTNRNQRGVRISIADSGAGMSRETLAHLYDAFFTTKDGTGTGLGMWVVAELIHRHHGALSVRSSTSPQHHGTVVSVFIPFGLDPQQLT